MERGYCLGAGFWALGSLVLDLGSGFDGLKRHGLGTTGSNRTTNHHVDGCNLRIWDAQGILE